MSEATDTLYAEEIRAGLTWKIVTSPTNPHMTDDDNPMSHFFVTVTNRSTGQAFTFHYSMGSAHALTWLQSSKRESRAARLVLAVGLKTYIYSQNVNRVSGEPLRALLEHAGAHGFLPSEQDVMIALCNMARDGGDNFENWAMDLGYDTDSRSAYATWEKCSEQARDLRRVFPAPEDWWSEAMEEIDQ